MTGGKEAKPLTERNHATTDAIFVGAVNPLVIVLVYIGQSHKQSLLSMASAPAPAKMTVNVQPLSKHLENGKYESQPPILKVPVALTHCGGPPN